MVSESIRRSGQSPPERPLSIPPESNPFESSWAADQSDNLFKDNLSNAKPLVSIIVPAYNESEILEQNLDILYQYMEYLERDYDWEIIIVNDGSKDNSGALAEGFARSRPYVRVIHHRVNSGLGQALRTGFAAANGEYMVTLDIDLSYTPEHIELLLHRIVNSGADVVVTSPYMRGGQVSNVPWLRLVLSVWANRFLSAAAKRNVSTLTGMVRAYRTSFVRSLNLKTSGMDINPEVIHKGIVLGAKIEEIPAHLNWRTQNNSRRASHDRPKPNRRKSSMKILRHTWSTFYFGFVFRPVMFFIIPSFFFFLLAIYAGGWAAIHSWTNYAALAKISPVTDPTVAVAAAFQQAPHTFVLGGIFLMLSIQLFSLGILSMQSKRYFEEIFQLGTATYTATQRSHHRP